MIGGNWHAPVVPYAGFASGRHRPPMRRFPRRPRVRNGYGRRAAYGPGPMVRYARAGGMMGVPPGLGMGGAGMGYGIGPGDIRDDYAIIQMLEAQRLRQMMALARDLHPGPGGLGGFGGSGGRHAMDDLELQTLSAKVDRLEEAMHIERRERDRTERAMETLGGLGGLTRGIGGLDLFDDDILDDRYRLLDTLPY